MSVKVLNICKSAKQLRSQRNHSAYRLKHSRRSAGNILPPGLVAMALEPLPWDSPLFQEALRSVDHFDNLAQWDEKMALQLAGRSAEGQRRILKRDKEFLQGQWEALACFLKDCQGGPRDIKMAEHLLHWCASKVFDLFLQMERLP
jgi:hypothetical protein